MASSPRSRPPRSPPRSALTRAVDEVGLQQSVRDHLVQAVREQGAVAIVELDAPSEPSDGGAPGADRRFNEHGIDTVLDVTISQVRLTRGGGVRPRVAVSMTAQARMVQTSDGAERYIEAFEYRGAVEDTVTSWPANDAAAFRQELDVAVRQLADDMSRVLFAREPAP